MRDSPLLKWLDRAIGIPLCGIAGGLIRLVDWMRLPGRPPARILLIKLSAVGDLVLLSPAVQAVRRRYPGARIEFLCTRVNDAVVRNDPLLDHVQLLEIDRMLRAPHLLLDFLTWLRRPPFDMVIDYDQWLRTTALVTIASGAKRRIGFTSPGQSRHWGYNVTVPIRPGVHETDHFRALTEAAGIPVDSWQPRIRIPAGERSRADALRRPGRRLVALHPGCGKTGIPRQWPAEKYVALANQVAADGAVDFLVTGGPGEAELTHRIAQEITGATVHVCSGALPFVRFAALLETAEVLVCGNTGALHVAAAVGTPVVALHGPTDPAKWGPFGTAHHIIQSDLACSPCLFHGMEYGCQTYPCMDRIAVEEVYRAVMDLLAGRNTRPVRTTETA